MDPCRKIENIASVRESVASIRHHGQDLNITRSTVQRILAKDLHLHKLQLVQEIKPRNHEHCGYADWISEQNQINADFFKKNIFSDGGHFEHDE